MTTGSNHSGGAEPDSKAAFLSKLSEGRQRFLAHVIEHSFECGRRSPEDFIRHFPPTAIMKGLETQAPLRANILVLTTGVKQKIALKKPWDDAARDLQIALEESETDAESIVALFDPDDRVRYLESNKLWNFLTEGDFWKAQSSNKASVDTSRLHVAFMLERALDDKLITHKDIVEGVTVDELATRLPKSELGRLIQCALQNAEKATPFTEADLLGTTPPRVLSQYVPLVHLWEAVIVPKIAQRHGYAAAPRVPDVKGAPEPELQSKVTLKEVPAPKPREAAASKKDAVPPKEASAPSASKEGAGPKLVPPPAQPELSPKAETPLRDDPGPGVHKTAAETDEYSDFEIIEEDIKAV